MSNTRHETQIEIINSLPIPCHGLLNLAPRVGKTKIGIEILRRESPIKKKILWVTPSTQLRDVDLPKEFIKWKAKVLLRKVTFICYKSLADHVGEYDTIVLDEYQDITVDNTAPLFNGQIKYKNIIGLSGTHPRHEIKQLILNNLGLSIIAKMGIDEAVDKGLIADYNINIIECELDSTNKYIVAGNKDKQWLQTEKKAYEYMSDNILKPFMAIKRMRFIYDSPVKERVAKTLLEKLGGRRLVFCSSIEQAERLGKNEVLGNLTYHSKTDKVMLDKFLNQEIDELFCVQAGGVGFTYKNVDNFIIIQANSDKKGDTTQKLARSLLSQENGYKGNIWFICLVDTKDKNWLEEALKDFDASKINVIKANEL